MKQTILASREGGETRVCLLKSGKLVNIDTEGSSSRSLVGNIYKGRIKDISRTLNAAFVDIGEGKEGFLSVQDVHPTILKGYGRNPHIWDIFDQGQEILVQVLRDPIKDKGAMLTTCVSLPGRFTVLIPADERTGVSKRLPDDERKRLRDLMKDVKVPDGFGIIVRTAGQARSSEELLRDLNALVDLWHRIEQTYGEHPAPALLVQEQNVVIRFLREYLTEEVTEIVTDEQELYKEVGRFLDLVMPVARKNLKLYQDRLPLLTRFGVETQIEKMFLQDVPLPSGGRIVIDRTEALIAVDVNSGRTRERDVEEMALKTNLEAAEEVANQLILRDLGGLVVIDFIDMDLQRNRTKVQNHLRTCLQDDKARVNLGKISEFGLLEMTRQRLRSGVVTRSTEICQACNGVGFRRTVPTDAVHIARKIRELALSGSMDQITVEAPVSVANYMQNDLRSLLHRLEEEYRLRIVILGREGIFSASIQGARLDGSTEKKPQVSPPTPAPVQQRSAQTEPTKSRTQTPAQEAPRADTTGSKEKAGSERRGRRGQKPKTTPDSLRTSERPQESSRAPEGPHTPERAGTQPRSGDKPEGRRGRRPRPTSRKELPMAAEAQTPRSEPPAIEPPPPRPPQDLPPPSLNRDLGGPPREGLLDSIIKKLLGLDK